MTQIEDKLYNLRKTSDRFVQSSSSNEATNKESDSCFDFPIDIDLNLESGNQNEHLLCNIQEVKNKELLCLSHFLNVIIKPWLDFGKECSVPSIKRIQYPIVLKNSISTIIKEFNGYISSYSADMKIHFLMSTA